MRRGEVRWYKFAPPDKRRPVLVLTRDSAIEFLGELTVAPITSTIRDIPTEVVIGPVDGMPRDCAVNLDHLQTVTKGRLEGVVTILSRSRMQQVQQAIAFSLGFTHTQQTYEDSDHWLWFDTPPRRRHWLYHRRAVDGDHAGG